ncbi:aldo/keto reductase [Fimbriimonas ginsengisoli]|uniref:Aldo/keto reductase n=1 Tax=Fimbriimonas ginsengisoli Gsoil 348 TaxID=661478 RepID=A0A068NM63_FIMGI|nr:aldo/keto reductase [Fimbriimonas ginsengisoli]AIE83875.1 aldo/keto reductase [Fimbriimonas ginsengisoli Gsoil 348]
MDKRRLGNSDLEITRIGIGAWAIGGSGYAFAWGDQDDDQSILAIQRALDHGINWIDTAAVYGLGHSEEIVAKAIRGMEQKPYVFTKCERAWDESGAITPSLKAQSIRNECEASLRRLKTDVIDLYQIHWPQPEEDIEEGWTTMAELQKEGKVRWIGVSNFNVEQMKRALAIAPITSLQPPYSAIRRDAEAEILPFCLENGIGAIVYSPMGSGLLTGSMTRERIASLPADDWRSRGAAFQEPLLTQNLAVADKFRSIAATHGLSAGEAAIAWTLHNPAVTAAIVGIRHPDQVTGIIGGADLRLTEAEFAEI